MRKIILEEWITLDGHISDKKGQLNFFTGMVRESYTDISRVKFLDTIDLILLGRNTYQQFVSLWPQRPTEQDALASTMNGTRKIVFSNTLTHAPWGKWPKAELANGDVITTIKELKSLPGKNIVLWGSVSLAQILMRENLIDEYHLHLCPALTSGGRRFFTGEINPTTLKLSETRQYGEGIVFLSYQATHSKGDS